MKIVRFLDNSDQERLGVMTSDRAARLVDGDIWANFPVTDETAVIKKLLAPVAARSILCIGLNYRAHAVETGAKIPEYPVLFMKSLGALQNPDDPIVIPSVAPMARPNAVLSSLSTTRVRTASTVCGACCSWGLFSDLTSS